MSVIFGRTARIGGISFTYHPLHSGIQSMKVLNDFSCCEHPVHRCLINHIGAFSQDRAYEDQPSAASSLIQMCEVLLYLVTSRVRPLTTMNIAICYCVPVRSSGVKPFRIGVSKVSARRNTAQVAQWLAIGQEDKHIGLCRTLLSRQSCAGVIFIPPFWASRAVPTPSLEIFRFAQSVKGSGAEISGPHW